MIEIGDWYRTCQECGNKQKATESKGELTNSYRNSKCLKCKSEALDYGTRKVPVHDEASEID